VARTGEPAACFDHARWLEACDPARFRAEVTDLYDKACRRGVGDACTIAAARNMADGELGDAARERSRECDLGNVAACHEAGVLMVRLWVDPTLAFDRLLKACKAGIGEACCEGAYLAYLGEGSSWVADNERPGHGGIWGGDGVANAATDARFAQDLYGRAVAQGYGGDVLCVELGKIGFVEGIVDPVRDQKAP
jgi:TPR repeat protein